MPFNMEKSSFRPDEWVAYGGGCWRVKRSSIWPRTWVALKRLPGSPEIDIRAPMIHGRTLRDVAAQVAAYGAPFIGIPDTEQRDV